MSEGYSWREVRGERPVRLPGPDHLGWWVAVALLVAVLLHAVAFLALGRVKIALGFGEAEALRTAPIQLDRVEVLPEMDLIEPTLDDVPPPDAANLLEEIDVLAALPEDLEMEISPAVVNPEFAIQPQQAVPEGEADVVEIDASADFDLDSALPELGRTPSPLPLAAEGQVIVDPGEVVAEDPTLDEFTAEILKEGAGGRAKDGDLEGLVSLDDLVGLPENVLVGKKTMLPSDLLFEYNSAELRESARVGLMKLALLIERNPGLYCWIEGHTDLFGGEAFNQNLSERRAEAVKSYLVSSLRLEADRIIPRGLGESEPLVASGSVAEQALNRRVEIKMRRERPSAAQAVKVSPQAAAQPEPAVAVEEPEPEPPKAILVKPKRDYPKAEVIEEPPPPAPKARVVEPEATPRAIPIEEETPRAVPVEEEPPRAVPVEGS